MYSAPMVCYALILLAMPFDLCSTENIERYGISISNLQMADDEKIVSFTFRMTAAAVQSVENIPVGWYLTVDNDASWQTHIKANTMIGSAALTLEEFKSLKLIIKKNEFMDLKFGLSATVSLTKDYEKERQVSITMSDFSIAAVR